MVRKMEARSPRGGRKVLAPPATTPSGAKIAGAPDIDLKQAGTFFGLIAVAVVVLSRLGSSWLVVICSTSLSVISSLFAFYFLFGSCIIPPIYHLEVTENQRIRKQVDSLNFPTLTQLQDKIALIDRNRKDIDSIIAEIGQQIDGFWIPLNFNLLSIERGERFILPIDIRHEVTMAITADDAEANFLKKYATFRINTASFDSLYGRVNERTLFEIPRNMFMKGQNGQTFELQLRHNLDADDKAALKRELAEMKLRVNHDDDMIGRISVLLVIRRPILTTGIEEGLPSTDGN